MGIMKDYWTRTASLVEDCSSETVILHHFLAHNEGEMITASKEYTLKNTSRLQVADAIQNLLDKSSPIQGYLVSEMFIVGAICNPKGKVGTEQPVLAVVSGNSRYDDDDVESFNYISVKVQITGSRHAHKAIFGHLDAKFGEVAIARIRWWHRGEHGDTNRTIYLEPLKTKLLPEFYPDFPMDPAELIKDYLKSEDSVLLLIGPPGTGKTTLLRHMIVDHSLVVDVVYDEKIMASDKVFQNFLFDSKSRVMIIEDADAVLTAREDANNHLMSRFLNVTDGLIRLPNKKLIFTTNLLDTKKVDPALMRPGRCYGTFRTRPLKVVEAEKAVAAAGLPPLDFSGVNEYKREYSLADLFKPRVRGE